MGRLLDLFTEIYGRSQFGAADHFSTTVGRITLEWAAAELIVDVVIEWLHYFGGRERIQSDLPVSFKNKLTYLQRATVRGALPQQFRDESVVLRRELKQLGKRRSRLVHSMALKYHPMVGGWRLVSSRFKQGERFHEQSVLRLDEPSELLSELRALEWRLNKFGEAVTTFLAAERDSERDR